MTTDEILKGILFLLYIHGLVSAICLTSISIDMSRVIKLIKAIKESQNDDNKKQRND